MNTTTATYIDDAIDCIDEVLNHFERTAPWFPVTISYREKVSKLMKEHTRATATQCSSRNYGNMENDIHQRIQCLVIDGHVEEALEHAAQQELEWILNCRDRVETEFDYIGRAITYKFRNKSDAALFKTFFYEAK